MLKFNYCSKFFFIVVTIFFGCNKNRPPQGTVFLDKNNIIHLDSSCKESQNIIIIKGVDELLEQVHFSNIQYCGKCIRGGEYENMKKYIQDIEVLDEIEYA